VTETQETEPEAEDIDLKTEEVTDEGESKDLYESFLHNDAV